MKSRLPTLMADEDIDQKELAARTGLSPTTVGKIYRNHFNRIDNHTVMALMKYFGLRRLDQLIEVIWEEDDVEGCRSDDANCHRQGYGDKDCL